ncbi:terpenoid cyclases/protein prenyltransferase alpha-alpha toroid [Amylostereum chailletii]|nr:terpenoid cyclases/protein prenyltransferase alpha-alpha toroid [Amylostereum chailletii]
MADEKDASTPLPPFDKPRHAAHCNRCIGGLPSSLIEIDSSRMAVGFYCLGTMDVLGVLDKKISATDRESWREWIWGQQAGGTTYCALASLYLVPTRISPRNTRLSPAQSAQTIRWLVHNQDEETGGFRGRTNKLADACYCFWCGASLDVSRLSFAIFAHLLHPTLSPVPFPFIPTSHPKMVNAMLTDRLLESVQILGQKDLLDARALAQFFARCQHKYGGVAKAPGESPDPYHTYLSAAMIAITPPSTHDVDPTWMLSTVDSLINSTAETVQWARTYIPAQLGP